MKSKSTGLQHFFDATKYSTQGLKAACSETAFKHHLAVLVPLSLLLIFLPFDASTKALLLASHLFLLILELLNTAIETTIDRISEEHHVLSGKAKDLGSAVVFLGIAIVAILWLGAIFQHLFY